MSVPPRSPVTRYRRRILAAGVIAAGALYSIGAPIFTNRIEADLERRVPEEMAEAGFEGVVAVFSGQDGTLHCAAALSDPEAAGEVAYDVWGVRAITVDRSCRVNRGSIADDGTASATSAGSTTGSAAEQRLGTIADVVGNDASLTYLSMLIDESGIGAQLADRGAAPVTLLAPTDDAFDSLPADINAQLRSDPALLERILEHHLVSGAITSDTISNSVTTIDGGSLAVVAGTAALTIGGASVIAADVAAVNGVVHLIDTVLLPDDLDDLDRVLTGSPLADQPGVVTAMIAAGTVTLTGVVGSEVERSRLVDAATFAAGADRVVDQLSVDSERAFDPTVAQSMAQLIAAAAVNLLTGSAGFDGTSLFVEGVYATDTNAEAVNAVAEAAGITAEIERLPAATVEQATQLETTVNALVLADPLQFESGQAVLTAEAPAVLDQVAARLIEVPGVAIVVEGHTDSDGDPAANLLLSQRRAETVRLALVERGVAVASITAEGFGSQEPVLVGGVEDKPSSRRVEFRVEPAS